MTVLAVEYKPPLWPHENIRLRQRFSRTPWELGKSVYLSLGDFAAYLNRFVGIGNFSLNEEKTMTFWNGTDAAFLADKYQFVQTVKKLGYTAPNQVKIPAGSSKEEITHALSQASLINEQKLYVKPQDGVQGIGIKTLPSEHIPDSLSASSRDYIVQENVNLPAEMRYIRALDKHNQSWRIAFNRVRPAVVGDGESSVRRLYKNARRNFPLHSRFSILTKSHSIPWDSIPEKGQLFQFTDVSNIAKGGYETVPQDVSEVESVDRFMQQFIHDLEKSVGHPLPLLVFDIGIKDPPVLTQDYNFNAMKKNVVFIECQIPFMSEGYYLHVPHPIKTFFTFHKAKSVYHPTTKSNNS